MCLKLYLSHNYYVTFRFISCLFVIDINFTVFHLHLEEKKMNKLLISLLSTLLLSNIASAQPSAHLYEANSLSKAVLEKVAIETKDIEVNVKAATPYTHESQQNNSLSRAALAKQRTKVFRITAEGVSYSRYAPHESERNHSLAHGALAK